LSSKLFFDIKAQALDKKEDMTKFSNLINNKNLIPSNKNSEKSSFTIKNFDKSIKLDLNPIEKV
jgi:hypothetical protein